MTILAWVVVGLAVGFVASWSLGPARHPLTGGILYAGVGAVAGGWLGSILMWIETTGVEFDSSALAVFGAAGLIAIGSLVLWRRNPRQRA
jgi:LPXTG-motif cell wall-anchored protein